MDANLQALIEKELADSDLHATDIPALDLYMDQIITLLSEKYEGNRRAPSEKILTKAMINNYSKEGLIQPVKGKKYSKEHIMQMLLVYALKNTLSIQEIKAVTTSAYPCDDFSLTDAWEDALAQRQIQRAELPSALQELCLPEGFDATDKTSQLCALLSVCALSSYCQRIAQSMVSAYFTDEHVDC